MTADAVAQRAPGYRAMERSRQERQEPARHQRNPADQTLQTVARELAFVSAHCDRVFLRAPCDSGHDPWGGPGPLVTTRPYGLREPADANAHSDVLCMVALVSICTKDQR